VWIGQLGPGGPGRVFSGIVGPRDADGETGDQVSVASDGVFVYQSAARLVRCSGAPMRLGLRRYDFARGRFVEAADLPPPAATVLAAGPVPADAPAGRPRVRFPFAFSSAPPADEPARTVDVRRLVAPLPLNDGDPATVWLSRGARGETLTARAASAGQQVTALRLLPGDSRSHARFVATARPRTLYLELGPGADQRFEVRLDPALAAGPEGHRRPLWVALPRPVPSSCVTIALREAAPGAEGRGSDVLAWGDIDVFTDLDGPEGSARLVQSLDGPDCESRIGDVAALGDEAVPGLAAMLARTAGAQRDCVLEALGRIPLERAPPAATAPLAQALAGGLRGASDAQEKALLALMRRSKPPPIAAVAALLGDAAAAEDDRARAARSLAALAEPGAEDAGPGRQAQDALLAAAGLGPPGVRAAVREALGGRGVGQLAALDAALAAAPGSAPERRADLTVALAIRLSRPAPEDPDGDRQRGLQRLLALAGRADEPFSVQARAVEGLGRIGGAEALGALARVRSGAPEPVLRRLATQALAGHRAVTAVVALRAALGDEDPEVRQLAAAGLARLKDAGATGLLIAGAKQEPWPVVRRAEVTALGTLCGPGASDLLARAVERDEDEVRRAALTGLVSCKDGRAVDTLLALLKRERESATLRTLAAGLLARTGDRRAAGPMAETLARLTVESQADLALEGTAVATLRALGSLGGPAALKAALAHASDPRPSLRRSAVEALGRLCDAAGIAALTAARRDPDPGVAAAAAAGLRRCGGSADVHRDVAP
jgi:HEAT repeat protein